MTYDDKNISDKLKKRAGTDFAGFDDERINRMFEAGMMAGSSRNRGSSRASNGSAQRGRGGQQDEAKAYFNDVFYGEKSDDFFDALTDTAAAAKAAGIKRVDSDKDVAEIRRKVNDEYMKRMIGAGVDGLAKAEDITEPATTTESKPVTSDTLLSAREKTKEYEEEIRPNLGQRMLDKYKIDLVNNVNSSSKAEDFKNYRDSYKMDLANKVNSSSKTKDFENIRDSDRLFS